MEDGVENNTTKRNHKILIAEDNPDARNLIDIYLGDSAFDIRIVVDGEELLDEFAKQHYDLVLTDIQMPKVDLDDIR